MGCANGSCSIAPRVSGVARKPCGMCEEDAYRLQMRNAFNPWGVNAGAGGSDIVPGDINPDTGQPWTSAEIAAGYATGGTGKTETGGSGSSSSSGGGTGAGAWDAARVLIEQAGRVITTQQTNDAAAAARAAQAAALAQYGNTGTMPPTRSSSSGITTGTPPPSSGSSPVLLIGLGLVAAVVSGVLKLPRGR
jgi:hypothetical protein